MPGRAAGRFEVTLVPAPLTDPEADPALGRMSITKIFHGGLEGMGRGEMLTAATGTDGSAVYVAIEQFIGTLDGRRGTFLLHHRGVLDRGDSDLEVEIVPDSGTGELAGITGRMSIDITDGVHAYVLEYGASAPR